MHKPAPFAASVLLMSALALPAAASADHTAAKRHHQPAPHPVKGAHYVAGSKASHYYVNLKVSSNGKAAKAQLYCFQWAGTGTFKISRTGAFTSQGRVNGITAFTIAGGFRSRSAARVRVHVTGMTCEPMSRTVTLKLVS